MDAILPAAILLAILGLVALAAAAESRHPLDDDRNTRSIAH